MKRIGVSISIYSLLLYSIVFYALVTLIYTFIPNIPLNKFFAMCIALNILYLYLISITVERFFILLICLFFTLYTTLISNFPNDNFNDLILMVTTVLIIGIAADSEFQIGLEQAIKRNKQMVNIIIIMMEMILLIAVFIPSNYANNSWGEDTSYFVGFTINGHTLASTCCLLIVLIMMNFNEKRSSLLQYLLYLIPLYCILFSGARTFLISVIILLIISIFVKRSSLFIRNIKILSILTLFIFALLKSSMASKFSFANNNEYAKNMLDSFTNGRSEFWKLDLELFSTSPLFIQFLGRGFDYIYSYNLKNIGISIWAHNDIINSLISIGIIGTLGYLYILFKYISSFYSKEYLKKGLFISLLFTLYLVAPMLINGLFPYQHYIYSCVLLGQILSQKKDYDF